MRRILCVEDDAETGTLIREELVERGYDVLQVGDGAAALAALIDQHFDLVLCDVSMPVMSGFDLLQRVGQLKPHRAHMPFIFLTALADRDHELQGRRLGADDYVTKPIDFDILEEVVKARLARLGPEELAKPEGPSLSEREAEVLTWSARGKTSADISIILGLAERTVNFHIENAMRKLGVASRIQAAVTASAAGLIKP